MIITAAQKMASSKAFPERGVLPEKPNVQVSLNREEI